MQTISIKSGSKEVVLPLLESALERERNILRNSIETIQEKTCTLAKKLSVDVKELMQGKVPHNEKNEAELIELEGELEILQRLKREMTELEKLEICK